MPFLRILRALIKPLTLGRRTEVQVQLRDASTPDFDSFLLVALSRVIVTLGLIIDSAVVILGATILARRREGEQLLLLCGQAIERGRVWAEVQNEEGRVGWVTLYYTYTATEPDPRSPTHTPGETSAPDA